MEGCHSASWKWVDFPKPVPEALDRVWRFTRSRGKLTVHCNDQLMLDFDFERDGQHSNCVANWQLEEDFGRVHLNHIDTATDRYRCKYNY